MKPAQLTAVCTRTYLCRIPAFRRQIQYQHVLRTLSNQYHSKTSNDTSFNKDNVKYCIDLVRNQDYDRYLIGLLLPRKYRNAYFVLRAFNAEIATINDNTRGNVAAGRLRFQYWQRALEMILPSPTKPEPQGFDPNDSQPVIRSLEYYVPRVNWSSGLFYRYLEARYRHFCSPQYETLSDFEDLTEATQSSLLYLCLELFDVKNDTLDQMTSHIGVSVGITTFLKSLQSSVAQEQGSFPHDLRMKYTLTTNILTAKYASADDEKRLKDAIFDLASQAAAHLDRAQKLHQELKKQNVYCLPILLETVSTAIFLEELRREDFNIFSPSIQPQNLRFKQLIGLLKVRLTWNI